MSEKERHTTGCKHETRAAGMREENERLRREIGERALVEEALRESELMYRTLFEGAPVGIVLATVDGHIFGYNDTMVKLVGCSESEALGQIDLADLFQDAEEHRFMMERARAEGSVRDIETVLKRQDTTPVDVILNVTLLTSRDEDFLLMVAEDITERKQAEKKLQEYADQLEEVNAELSEYAYAVSHDIRAPLRAIRNYADFLEEDLRGKLGAEQKTYLDNLSRAVVEAEAFAKDLLALSRIGWKAVPVETVDVGGFLRTLVDSLQLPQDVEVLMADAWPSVEVEPTLMQQIFQNLITNAVKFNESGRKVVELGWTETDEAHFEFFVRDNGIGIDSRYSEQIFRVFERLHTNKEYDGTGIGLAIVKKAARKLNGSVRLISTLGKGSTFFVKLPKTQRKNG